MHVKTTRNGNRRRKNSQRLTVLIRGDLRRRVCRRLCRRWRLQLEQGVEICRGHDVSEARLALNLRRLLRLLQRLGLGWRLLGLKLLLLLLSS